jgi:septal ring factor EnvC (AmiA/AmiB activator)
MSTLEIARLHDIMLEKYDAFMEEKRKMKAELARPTNQFTIVLAAYYDAAAVWEVANFNLNVALDKSTAELLATNAGQLHAKSTELLAMRNATNALADELAKNAGQLHSKSAELLAMRNVTNALAAELETIESNRALLTVRKRHFTDFIAKGLEMQIEK